MNYSADQIALRDYLLAEEASTKARIDSGEITFATWYVTELDHWASYGVFSVADMERYDLAAYISDESKAAYGHKMRVDFQEHTKEQLERWADKISNDAHDAYERTQEIQALAQAEFETLIANTILTGAGDRATAIRWILEGEDLLEEMDMGFVEYKFDLAYGSYAKEFEAVQKRAFA